MKRRVWPYFVMIYLAYALWCLGINNLVLGSQHPLALLAVAGSLVWLHLIYERFTPRPTDTMMVQPFWVGVLFALALASTLLQAAGVPPEWCALIVLGTAVVMACAWVIRQARKVSDSRMVTMTIAMPLPQIDVNGRPADAMTHVTAADMARLTRITVARPDASRLDELKRLLPGNDEARWFFDPESDFNRPCISCGTTARARALREVGRATRAFGGGYRAGDAIERPMCDACFKDRS